MDGDLGGRMNEWMDGCLDGWINAWMDRRWMDG